MRLYCYLVTSFSLKNAGTTYQRLVNSMFIDQIGRSMEVYVDDMLVKSRRSTSHLEDLSKILACCEDMEWSSIRRNARFKLREVLRFYCKLKKNWGQSRKDWSLKKCWSPKDDNGGQSLNMEDSRTKMLKTIFILKTIDKCIPFFDVLKVGKRNFAWTQECKDDFQA